MDYAKALIHNIVLGNHKTCIYQLNFDKEVIDNTQDLQYFSMHSVGIFIKLNSYISHMFYAFPFHHNTVILILLEVNKYYLDLYTQTTVFLFGGILVEEKIDI